MIDEPEGQQSFLNESTSLTCECGTVCCGVIEIENHMKVHEKLRQCKYCKAGNCNMCQSMGTFADCLCCVEFRFNLIRKTGKAIAQFNPKTLAELRRLIR